VPAYTCVEESKRTASMEFLEEAQVEGKEQKQQNPGKLALD